MSEYTNLKLEKRGHTAIVTLFNPPAHTWTMESLKALKALVLDLNNDREVYALVITGDGNKFFSAGADLNVFADGNKDVARDMAQRCFGESVRNTQCIPWCQYRRDQRLCHGRRPGMRAGLRPAHHRRARPGRAAGGHRRPAAMRRWHPEPAAPGRRGLGQAHDSLLAERVNAATVTRSALRLLPNRSCRQVPRLEAAVAALATTGRRSKAPAAFTACKILIQSSQKPIH